MHDGVVKMVETPADKLLALHAELFEEHVAELLHLVLHPLVSIFYNLSCDRSNDLIATRGRRRRQHGG